jgi:uncharacterized membrane protein YgcG
VPEAQSLLPKFAIVMAAGVLLVFLWTWMRALARLILRRQARLGTKPGPALGLVLAVSVAFVGAAVVEKDQENDSDGSGDGGGDGGGGGGD